MNTEAFIQWALDPARSNEERYTVELIVESAMLFWHARNQTAVHEAPELAEERKRQRKLNPAYVASYSEQDLRRAAEVLPDQKHWQHIPYVDRPVRDLKAFEFLDLLSLELTTCEVVDLEPAARIPSLQSFTFSSTECLDFRPLGSCPNLRYLKLTFMVPWPEVSGLERLTGLEEIHLSGNLLAFAPGVEWPNVRRGWLTCGPLAARRCADLPALPNCLFLTLGGVDRLEGIERMGRLLNLVLQGSVRDYAPLAALKELTCLTLEGDKPRDVRPLVQLPKLQFAQFGDPFLANTPRDYSPLAEAPMLRELIVLGCPPVEMEVAAINAGLAHWEDVLFAPKPRPVPPLQMRISPDHLQPAQATESSEPVDLGLRAREGRWVAEFLQREILQRTEIPDWGIVSANGKDRTFYIELHSFDAVEMFPEFLQTVRECLARLRPTYLGTLVVALQNPSPRLSSAELEREEQLREIQDDADFDQWQRDQEDYLDRLHRYELKKQEGGPIDPAEFSVPDPQAGNDWEDEEDPEFLEEDQEIEEEDLFFPEAEHPLADHYRVMADLSLEAIRFHPDQRRIAIHLMRRGPDEPSSL